MAPLASTTELRQWKQLDEAEFDTDSATLAVAGASGMIRSHCGWDISQTTVTDAILDGPGGRSLWLPTLKLTAVGSVVVNGDVLTVDTQYDWTSYGKLIHRGCWPCKPRSITVTYTHGWATVPDVVKTACLIVAGILYDNPEMLGSMSEAWGPFNQSRSYPSTAPAAFGKTGLSGGLPAAVMEMLGPFKLEYVG